MSFICSSTPSTSGPLVSKVAHRQVLAFLYPFDFYHHTIPPSRRRIARTSRSHDGGAGGVEAWFISSLARAGNCQQHTRKAPHTSSLFSPSRPEPRAVPLRSGRVVCRRFQHTNIDFNFSQRPLPEPESEHDHKDPRDAEGDIAAEAGECEPDSKPETWSNRTREELLDLVDQYSGESYTNQLPLLEIPSLYQPSDGPHLTVSDKPGDEWPPPHYAWPADMETKRKLQCLDLALLDFNKDPEEIFQLYRELPGPRVPYMSSKARHKFLRHLSVVERKDEHSMLRYLSVVDDMKNMAIPLSISEWTSALSFVSRYVTTSTDIEVEAALHMWKEMEHVAGVKGNGSTFNVLFDVACKAGKFTLAEMIYREMEKRGHQFNRYHHVSLIYYYGLKQNGDGARAAYRELVNAGELVDTVIMNAMISALIRAREPDAAENIYQRMKHRCLEDTDIKPQPKDYKSRRVITGTLMRLAAKSRKSPENRERYQKRASLVPDSHTYQVLINHFAVQVGDLPKTTELLNDRKLFNLPVQGALFLSLFKSFAIHGGIRYTEWTEARLNNVLSAFVKAVEDETEGLYISKWMVVWILRAFARCAGNRERTMEVWEMLQALWVGASENDVDFVLIGLRELLDEESAGSGRGDWLLGTEGGV